MELWRSQLLLEAIADGRPPNPEHIARMRADADRFQIAAPADF